LLAKPSAKHDKMTTSSAETLAKLVKEATGINAQVRLTRHGICELLVGQDISESTGLQDILGKAGIDTAEPKWENNYHTQVIPLVGTPERWLGKMVDAVVAKRINNGGERGLSNHPVSKLPLTPQATRIAVMQEYGLTQLAGVGRG
jgi:hypothetical protein